MLEFLSLQCFLKRKKTDYRKGLPKQEILMLMANFNAKIDKRREGKTLSVFAFDMT